MIVTQCDRNVLDVLCEFTGAGKVYFKREAKGKWREAHQWKIGGLKAIKFLESIVDKLVLKKAEAQLLIDNQDLFRYQKNSEELLARRSEVASQL